MNRSTIQYLCFLIFSAPFFLFAKGQGITQKSNIETFDCQCERSRDSLSLLSLYFATDGPNWKNKWDLKKPIHQWYGIALGPNGCVRTIDMDGDPNFSLQRKNGNGLKGEIPDLVLPSLVNLLLASNQLSGEIPKFSCMPNLRILQLSCNQFAGKVPDFSTTPNLKAVELDYNQLTGTIPDLSTLPHLEWFYISNNQLVGSIPPFKNSSKLHSFIASNNQLSGTLPDFRHNPSLKKMMISNNQLSEGLPDLGHLSNLTHLDLSNNQLEGVLFDWEFCPQLRYVTLEHNNLEGTVPDIKSLSNLELLILSSNEFTGELPDPSNLVKLHTYLTSNNDFTSAPVFQNTTALKFLALNNNRLNFRDILPNQPKGETVFQYLEQTISESDSLMISQLDSTLTISINNQDNIPNLEYQWFHNGSMIEEDGTTNQLVFDRVKQKDIGLYYCQMTHPNLPGLVLTSTAMQLIVQGTEGPTEVLAIEDVYAINNCIKKQTIDLLKNDFLPDPNVWDIELLSTPEKGSLEQIGKGKYTFTVPEYFSGIISFDYQVCHNEKEELCSESYVEIIISQKKCQENPELFIPSAISPNDDGINDVFFISQLEKEPSKYDNNELVIFDVQGRPVFHAKPYRNDWNGRFQHTGAALPAGVYFYQFNTGVDHQAIQSGSIMVMH